MSVVACVLGAVLVIQLPIAGGDTIPLAESSRALIACARSSVWSGCLGRIGLGSNNT